MPGIAYMTQFLSCQIDVLFRERKKLLLWFAHYTTGESQAKCARSNTENHEKQWLLPLKISFPCILLFHFSDFGECRCFSQIAFLIIPNMWSSLMWTNTICLRLFSVISRKLSASKKLGLKLCCVYQPGIRKKSTLSVLNPFSSCHLWKPNQCWPFLEFVFTTIDYLEDCCFA